MSFFNSRLQRVGYGAIMYNGSASGLSSCYPFFTSHSNLAALPSRTNSGAAGTISVGDVDDYWTVMPGYKLEVYANVSYSSLLLTADNTSGVVPVNYTISPNVNQASSLRLFFNGTLIEQPGTFARINGSTVTVSNYATTYDIAYGSNYYHVYEFYAGSNGTLSFTGGGTVSNILGLLIGGGGGGGQYVTAGATAAGAGGAGTFLTTIFNAIPGSTFTVNVGAGGAGAAASTTNPGTFGSTTSITRTYNSVVDATLTAGGGGGGGAAGNMIGTIGTIYGSTGGTGGQISSAGLTAARVASNAVNVAYTVTGSVFTAPFAYVSTGGNSSWTGGGGGGGGAGGTGGNASGNYPGGNGGNGLSWGVIGSSRLFAGGGGAVNSTSGGPAGLAGSGGGGSFANPVIAATENTGSGGASAYSTIAAGKGANGICIIAIPG